MARMRGQDWRHPDLAVAAVVVAFGAAAFVATLGFDRVPEALMEGMGPERFPQLVIGTMVLLAVLLGVRALGLSAPAPPRIPPMFAATLALLVAAVVVFPHLGLVPTMTAAMVALGALWGERRWHLLVGVALAFGLAVHLLFVRTLGITLPVGPFGFLLG
ncbi:tripartite tricarboxylate transporter TctB family protein [Elioraea sp.]|uniref:tripartite tricarboxylate transporter TctB family protein n=1 Tax=Elioraea sp. TaxID=2185103 RepID=UPI0026334F6C|nr:tripartite tricarboxylate transporter TctB family protein [Elioraea sp.]